ncbi:hypothetical protein CRYUN_Cryun07bG0188300 [Craigia yunnanensis]
MEEKREHTQQINEENPSKEGQPIEEDKYLQPMKEKEGIKQVYQKEKNKEITDAHDEDKQEERVIIMLEENQLLDGIKEEKDRNGEDIIVENQVLKAEKVGENQTALAKKPKQGSKQSLKAKPTIPQPFSLSTEKRLSKEKRGSIDFSSENMKRKPKQRHGSMDFKNSFSQPRLSRSVSLSHRDQSPANARETSDLRHAKSICGTSKTSSRPQVTAPENIENRIGNDQKTMDKTLLKGAESKHLKGNDKKQRAEEKESSHLQKSSKFKALPLPRFYQKKYSPSKSETKKMPEIDSKSTLLGQQNCPRSISKVENNKIEDKGKGPLETITNGAKGTISKLLRSTRKVLNTSKGATKGIVSSG